MQQFKASKIQSQTAEEYLKAFLDAEVRPLWPRGWIQTRSASKLRSGTFQPAFMLNPCIYEVSNFDVLCEMET